MSTDVLERAEGRFVVGEVQMTIICWARGTTKQNAQRNMAGINEAKANAKVRKK